MDFPICRSQSFQSNPNPIFHMVANQVVAIVGLNEVVVVPLYRVNIRRVPEIVDLLLDAFIPTCKDVVIDSNDEYDNNREEKSTTTL